MSLYFGPMRQLGYVVRDVEESMELWTTRFGVGPFFHEPLIELTGFVHDGTERGSATIRLACANSGDVQIELIELVDETPSMFREFVEANGWGLQHWAAWPIAYDERLQRALDAGWVVGQSGDSVRGRFTYLRDPIDPTRAVELAEALPERMACYDRIREAATEWDGRDPVRRGMP
jgi:hypothetical protein